MRLPEKDQLPLSTPLAHFQIDQTKLEEFHLAFRDQLLYTPPTLMAVTMKGMFDLLESFEVDWKRLLHATQSFSYHAKLSVPVRVAAETRLIDLRFRASMHWLTFEMSLKNSEDESLLVTGKSLLMIREEKDLK